MVARLTLLLFFAAMGGLPAAGNVAPEEEAQSNTWSVVAIDESTGDVGVAGASCFPQAVDAIAALVPGYGAAATQAAFSVQNRDAVFAMLQEGETAETIVEAVTRADADRETALRQYGVVTVNGGSTGVLGYTGSENQSWAGDRQRAKALVTVQGNLLESEAVVLDALEAFEAGLEGGLPLSDRLMNGLETGAAAGGDRRCNRNGLRQTASAAFIMVAREGDRPFAVRTLGREETDRSDAPWLYLSVSLPVGGENAVAALRAAYEERMAEKAPPGSGANSIWASIWFLVLPVLALAALATSLRIRRRD